MKNNSLFQLSLGIGLAVLLSIFSYYLGDLLDLNLVLLALIVGVVVGNIWAIPNQFEKGIKYSSGKFLEFSIVLMAFGINYGLFLDIGWQAIITIVVSMALLLVATIYLSKTLKCPGSTGWLVGFGTAICGSSAIAALAPSVSKEKSDIGIALAVVNLFGLIGMIAIPLVTGDVLTDVQNSILIGGGLHSVGNVAGAGFSISDAVGEMSITVKMGRIALLTPALLIFSFFAGPEGKETGAAKISLPWYLVLFVLISIVVSLYPLNQELGEYVKQLSTWLLAIAMAAIGLKVSFKQLLSTGKKGMVFGLIIFGIQLALLGMLMVILQI